MELNIRFESIQKVSKDKNLRLGGYGWTDYSGNCDELYYRLDNNLEVYINFHNLPEQYDRWKLRNFIIPKYVEQISVWRSCRDGSRCRVCNVPFDGEKLPYSLL